jgi:hypothetical protein
MKTTFLISFLLFNLFGFSTVYDTLYINKDTAHVGIETRHFCFFNKTANFSQTNHHLYLPSNESLELYIQNNDSLIQNFSIDGVINQDIPAFSSTTVTLNNLSEGAYRYYSNKLYGEKLGASGILISGYDNYSRYGWNMYELQGFRNDSIALSLNEPSVNYLPDFFLINANHHPNTMTDSTSRVTGNVGDSIIISIANSGRMIHSLHFHGYHVQILHSNNPNNFQINWSKDSFGIEIGEVITVLLVPDKEGEYPVHDHNLRAVTNAGVYPGGMINRLSIQP